MAEVELLPIATMIHLILGLMTIIIEVIMFEISASEVN